MFLWASFEKFLVLNEQKCSVSKIMLKLSLGRPLCVIYLNYYIGRSQTTLHHSPELLPWEKLMTAFHPLMVLQQYLHCSTSYGLLHTLNCLLIFAFPNYSFEVIFYFHIVWFMLSFSSCYTFYGIKKYAKVPGGYTSVVSPYEYMAVTEKIRKTPCAILLLFRL